MAPNDVVDDVDGKLVQTQSPNFPHANTVTVDMGDQDDPEMEQKLINEG
jgi:hypothetical protein